jgi:hypothetical protein
MVWTKSSPDPTPNGSATGPTSKVQSECIWVNIKEVIRQPINDVNAVSEDSGKESNTPYDGASSSDPTPYGSALELTSKAVKEGEKPSIIPLSCECVLVDSRK